MPLQEYSFIFCIRYLQNNDPNTINFAIEQNNTLVFKSAPQTGVKLNWNKQMIVLDPDQSFTILILKNEEQVTIGQAVATIDSIETDNKIEFINLENTLQNVLQNSVLHGVHPDQRTSSSRNSSKTANFNAYIYTTLYEAKETVNRQVASQIVR